MVFDEDTGEALNPLVQMMRSGLGSKYEEVRCLPVTPLPPYSLPYEAALEGEDTYPIALPPYAAALASCAHAPTPALLLL